MIKKVLFILVISFAIFAQKPPIINGFFIQPALGYGAPNFDFDYFKTQDSFNSWIKSMADIGANMLFYQWVSRYEYDVSWFTGVHGGEPADFCYYEQDLKVINGIPSDTWMKSISQWTGSNVSPIEMALIAGEKQGVDIWLGLYLNEDNREDVSLRTYNWWDAVAGNDITAKDTAIFRYHVERSIDIAGDLTNKFGHYSSLGGFYYSIEIANNIVFNNEEHWQILAETLSDVAKEVYNLSGKRLAISPFFNTHTDQGFMSSEKYGEMWDYMLSKLETKNLIVMLQDGVGVEPNTIDKIEPFYRAVSDACKKNGIAFWGNSELFTNPSGDRMASESQPTNIEKLSEQMKIASEFADTFVCFSYLSMDSVVQTLPSFLNVNDSYSLEKRTKLYADYKAYYDSVKIIRDSIDNIDTTTSILTKKPNFKSYFISVSGNKISIPKFDKPVSYSLVSPNGKIVLSGVAEKAKVIKAPAATGIYILTLKIAEQAVPVKQKIFLQNNTQSTINYRLR